MKRIFDFTFSLVALILLSPIFIIITLLVWINLGRPIFFNQDRPGLKGKPFKMFKFRTMKNKVDLTQQDLEDLSRMTPFGKMLRKTSLDELPELLNVLRGEMSLVGPRPLLMEYLPLYSKQQLQRHNVKPGITGWAQINGRNEISWEKKFELDIWYVNNNNFFLDIKILVATIAKVIKKEGISADGHVTIEPFKGNKNLKNNK